MTSSFKRVAIAIAACAALLAVAAPASARTIKGTVVHHNPHAHSFVLAANNGHLTAIHARRSPAVGRVVGVSARRLRNGTFAAKRISAHGRRTHARLRGTVSFVDARHGTFVLSARGTSIRVRRASARGGAAASTTAPLPAVGKEVEINATLDDQGNLETDEVQVLGEDTNGIDLEGVVLSVDTVARTLTVSADEDNENGQSVLVHVPEAIDISAFQAGQEVELTVTPTADGFLLQGSSLNGCAQEADDQSTEQGDSGEGSSHESEDHHGEQVGSGD